MKKGYTFTETIAALVLLGILFVATIVNVGKLSTNSNMARFKKGYANLEKAIASLTSDESIYSAQSGFKDTSLVKMGFDNEDEGFEVVDVIGKTDTSKFREAIKYKMNVVKDELECSIYSVDKTDGTKGGKVSKNCFMTDDGVVFGVPDTDFRKKGTMVIRDYDKDNIVVSPVTMYVDYNGKIKDPSKDAFIIGIGADGNMQFIRTFDNCKDEPKVLQCNLDKYIKADNISEIDESEKEK